MRESRRRVHFVTELSGNELKDRLGEVLKRYDEVASLEEAEFIVFDLENLPSNWLKCVPQERREIDANLDHYSLPCFLVKLRRPANSRREDDREAALSGVHSHSSPGRSASVGDHGSGGEPSGEPRSRRRGIRRERKMLVEHYQTVFEVDPPVAANCDELLTQMKWLENMLPFRRRRTLPAEQVMQQTIAAMKVIGGTGEARK